MCLKNQKCAGAVAAGVPPAVEGGILPPGKNRLPGGNTHFYQVDCDVALFPPGGTHRLYVSKDGQRYHFQTRSESMMGEARFKSLWTSSPMSGKNLLMGAWHGHDVMNRPASCRAFNLVDRSAGANNPRTIKSNTRSFILLSHNKP